MEYFFSLIIYFDLNLTTKLSPQDKGRLLSELSEFYTEVFYTAPVQQTAQLMYQRNFPVYMFVNKFPVGNKQTNLRNRDGIKH